MDSDGQDKGSSSGSEESFGSAYNESFGSTRDEVINALKESPEPFKSTSVIDKKQEQMVLSSQHENKLEIETLRLREIAEELRKAKALKQEELHTFETMEKIIFAREQHQAQGCCVIA